MLARRVPAEDSSPARSFYLPFAHGFPTRTGKALLYNEDLAAQGLDPVVSFTPPQGIASRAAMRATRSNCWPASATTI